MDPLHNASTSEVYQVLKCLARMPDILIESQDVEHAFAILNLLLASQATLTDEELFMAFVYSQKPYDQHRQYIEACKRFQNIFDTTRQACDPVFQYVRECEHPQDKTLAISEAAGKHSSMNIEDAGYASKTNATTGHILWAKACLRLLTAIQDTDQKPCIKSYATSHWPLHLARCGSHVSDFVDLVADFFVLPQMGFSAWSLERAISESMEAGVKRAPKLPPVYAIVDFELGNVLEHFKPCVNTGMALIAGREINLNESFKQKDADDITPLELAIDKGLNELAFKLIELGAAGSTDKVGMSPIHLAVTAGSIELIEKCHELGHDMNAQRKASSTGQSQKAVVYPPLFYAMDHADDSVFDALLRLGSTAVINASDGHCILHDAARNGRIHYLKKILEAKLVDVNCKAILGATALMHAVVAKTNARECVDYLLSQQADANLIDDWNRTALWYTALAGPSSILVHLLPLTEAFDIPSSRNDEWKDWTALHLCAHFGLLSSVRALLLKGARTDLVSNSQRSALRVALEARRADVACELIESGANVNAASDLGRNPLYLAAENGMTKVVKLLLAHGASDVQDETCITALQISAYNNHAEVLECLLQSQGNGVNINQAHKSSGYTALNAAIDKSHSEIVRRLVAAGVDLSLRSASGWLPLHDVASKSIPEDVFDLVLSKTKPELISATTKYGSTPVALAAGEGAVYKINRLIEAGADCYVTNDSKHTALMLACSNGDAEAIKPFLKCPDDWFDQQDKNGFKALHYAAQKVKDRQILTALVSRTKWEHRKRTVSTPIRLAANENNIIAVEVFLEHGMPADFRGGNGRIALYESVDFPDSAVMKLLLANGADPNQATLHNITPYILSLYPAIDEAVQGLKPIDLQLLHQKTFTILTNGALETARCDSQMLRKAIADGVPANGRDYVGHTVFHYAADRPYTGTLDYLLTLPDLLPLLGVPCDITHRTVLVATVMTRKLSAVQAVLQHADPKTKQKLLRQRDFLGFSVYDYAHVHEPIKLALLEADYQAYVDWHEDTTSPNLSLQVYILLKWFEYIRTQDIYVYSNIKDNFFSVLSMILLFAGDEKNGITAEEQSYPEPSSHADGYWGCNICSTFRRRSGWLCTQCAYAGFCSECKDDPVKWESFGCSTHRVVQFPSKSWYTRSSKHVNEDKQTQKEWLEELTSTYKTKAGPLPFDEEDPLCFRRLVPFDYEERPDILQLFKDKPWAEVKEHLCLYPRDIWQRDEQGNTMVMQCIQTATDEKTCLDTLHSLAAEGAVLLTVNTEGQSSVDLACSKNYESVTTYLLSTYDEEFSGTKTLDKVGNRPEQTMKALIANEWRDALLFAVERHSKWAVVGEFAFVKDLYDEKKLVDDQIVDFLLRNSMRMRDDWSVISMGDSDFDEKASMRSQSVFDEKRELDLLKSSTRRRRWTQRDRIRGFSFGDDRSDRRGLLGGSSKEKGEQGDDAFSRAAGSGQDGGGGSSSRNRLSSAMGKVVTSLRFWQR